MRIPWQLILAGGLVAVLGPAAAAGFLWHRHRVATRAAAAQLAELRAEQEELRALADEFRPERMEARAAEIAAAESEIEGYLNGLSRAGGPQPESETPATPLEVFLELAAFRATMQARAEAAGVQVTPPAWFGFSAHARSAPGENITAEVRRQREALERLLDLLWRARPLALLAIHRERPEGSPPGGPADDFFVLDTGRAVRQAGRFDSCAFRLEFSGTTAVLHALVARMITREPTMFLRLVAAGPVEERAAGEGGTTASAGDGGPLAGPVRFTVVVEVVRPTAFDGDFPFSR